MRTAVPLTFSVFCFSNCLCEFAWEYEDENVENIRSMCVHIEELNMFVPNTGKEGAQGSK